MDSRRISEEYTRIGEKLIKTMPELAYIKDSDAQIIFLASEHKKSANNKKIFGQCEKVQEKYKWGIPCDFTITVFEPNCDEFTPEQLKILLFHELLHVGIDGSRYYIRPHDLEDFKLIVNLYGTEWSETKSSKEKAPQTSAGLTDTLYQSEN